ncbi:MAG: hypothetical protein RIE53_00595 [Rhodothermales bacterium]
MRFHVRILPVLMALILLPACDSNDDGVVCTTEARPAITVTVTIDSGETPEDGIYEATVTDGDFRDTQPVVNGNASLAHERAGTYRVAVTTTQGQPVWHQDDVRVTRDECHVETVELTALVEPQ